MNITLIDIILDATYYVIPDDLILVRGHTQVRL